MLRLKIDWVIVWELYTIFVVLNFRSVDRRQKCI